MDKKECALGRRELALGQSHVTLSVGLNPQGGSELVEESHELDFCTVASAAWPEGCAAKASLMLDFFVQRLWELRAEDPPPAPMSGGCFVPGCEEHPSPVFGGGTAP
jgi:hypothetical protein